MKSSSILFVNACVRPSSRTYRLAQHVLSCLDGKVTEVNLERENLQALTAESVEAREALLGSGALDDDMFRYARQLASAYEVVLAAPYWDLSFPSMVKTWLEHVTVRGVTFSYGEDGMPVGHCAAKHLYYVMTAGGPIVPPNHGYAYVRDLCTTFYGIADTVLFSAEMLDVVGMDEDAIVAQAISRVDDFFQGR